MPQDGPWAATGRAARQNNDVKSKVEDRSPQPPTNLAAGAVPPGSEDGAPTFEADEAGCQPVGTGG